jgi:hypothetical protein
VQLDCFCIGRHASSAWTSIPRAATRWRCVTDRSAACTPCLLAMERVSTPGKPGTQRSRYRAEPRAVHAHQGHTHTDSGISASRAAAARRCPVHLRRGGWRHRPRRSRCRALRRTRTR